MAKVSALSPKTLRWNCPDEAFDFTTTQTVPPDGEVVGQDSALAALQFGIECRAKGQNIFIRGESGTGRMTAVRQLLKELAPQVEAKYEFCYVHNFSRPDRPRLIRLGVGEARNFRRRIKRLTDCIRNELPKILEGEAAEAQRSQLKETAQARIKALSTPFQEQLSQAGLALVTIPQGQEAQNVIMPLVEGKPVPPNDYQQMIGEGKISLEQEQAFKQTYPKVQKKLQSIGKKIGALYQETAEQLQDVNEQIVREALDNQIMAISSAFPQASVDLFLRELSDDAVDLLLNNDDKKKNLEHRYGVNIILERRPGQDAPVVEESSSTLPQLIGLVEPRWQGQMAISDYSGIRAGALLRADGGYLVLHATDLLGEPGAWRSLIRALKTGQLEIVPAELGLYGPHQILKPEPIPVNVRVILIGNTSLHYQLARLDPDFVELFKVLADFDNEMERNPESLGQYARVVSGLVQDEGLRHFTASGVAALCEHGARIASNANKLTTRFGRIADIAREAAFVAVKEQHPFVERSHVESAIRRTRDRAKLPSTKFRDLIHRGTLIIQTRGSVVGQVNGLAVVSAGPLTYGFPARITATIGAGHAGIIDIEGRASMSGSIHTKGVNILEGLLRHMLRLDHPVAFSASLAFEQSYGGIDGDSASGAETCCLLSALTHVPLNQELSMTGAIDQHGHIQAIGGVNEKIEGFFEICRLFGLTGTQGVIIPKANVADLMLRRGVAEASEQGQFHIYAVENIQQALELLTGCPAGEPGKDGGYPEDSLLHLAQTKARKYWEETLKTPDDGI